MAPVYFWTMGGKNDYLCQWYPTPFFHEGIKYTTAEMWMMVSKARLFSDDDALKAMINTNDPKKHKALGRKVKGYDGDVWDQNKLKIVEEGNWLKFTTSKGFEELQKQLLETGDREIVEASPADRIWGIGFREIDAAENRDNWGENLLGVALMNVRRRIREQKLEEGKTKV